MSDLLAAAAAALGVPETLIERAAQARAEASGATVDDVLQAWAGGGSVAPVTAAAPAEAPQEPEIEDEAATPSEETPEDAIAAVEPVAAPPPAAHEPEVPMAPADGRPPLLIGIKDNPLSVAVAALGLFLAIVVVGFIGPASPVDHPGARSSQLALSADALIGRDLYASLGCGACHTQMVRPIVSDVGLGAVSLSDSNQILGTRRFGPDLSDVGSRMSVPEMEAIVEGLGEHAAFSLSTEDMASLLAYLGESKTVAAG